MNKEEIENYISELESMFELSELEEHSRNILKVGIYIKQLQQENKHLKEHIEKYEHYCKTTGIEELMKENKKYKEVIDKAIEYIDDWLFNVGGMGACMDYKDIKEILDILKEDE